MKNYINKKEEVKKEIAFYKGLHPIITCMNEYELSLCIKLRKLLLRNNWKANEFQTETQVKSFIRRKYESLDNGRIKNEEDIYILKKFRSILTELSMGKYNLFYVRRGYLLEKNRINMLCYNY